MLFGGLQEVHPNFDSLSEEEQTALSRLAIFFCGLHALIHYAETAEQCLSNFEGRKRKPVKN